MILVVKILLGELIGFFLYLSLGLSWFFGIENVEAPSLDLFRNL
jgi:hypothetical protein